MQRTGLYNLIQLPAQSQQLIINRAPIRLNLRLTWATHETQTTALPLQMRPGAHQTGALIP